MTLDGYHALITDDPVALIRNGLRFVHFIGLALGLGGATLLDVMLFRYFLRRRISDAACDIFMSSTHVVDIGLRVLWLTGIGFLVLYALTDPEKLANPKIHAKFVIVSILTLNGLFIHRHVLGIIQAQVGKTLFDGLSPVRRAVFAGSAAISVTSWYMPVALGVFAQLNNTVPAIDLLAIYGMLVLLVVGVIHGVNAVSAPRQKTPEIVAGE